MINIPPTSSDEFTEAGITFTREPYPFKDPFALSKPMRNKYEMKCWRCGKRLEPDEGIVNLKESIPALKVRILKHKNEKWVAECAILCETEND